MYYTNGTHTHTYTHKNRFYGSGFAKRKTFIIGIVVICSSMSLIDIKFSMDSNKLNKLLSRVSVQRDLPTYLFGGKSKIK